MPHGCLFTAKVLEVAMEELIEYIRMSFTSMRISNVIYCTIFRQWNNYAKAPQG